MADQLSLNLHQRPALGRDDFVVAGSNAVAAAMMTDRAHWPASKLLLLGPAGSGKTHLTHVWAAENGARIVPAQGLAVADIPALAADHVAVEDVDGIAGDAAGEEALLHLHNLVLAEGHALLMTALPAPATWPITLPDLASRLQATATANLAQPDDALLGAVLAKLFADRQLVPGSGVVAYLLRHMDRSFDTAGRVVAAIDRAALAQRRPVTVPLARETLAQSDCAS